MAGTVKQPRIKFDTRARELDWARGGGFAPKNKVPVLHARAMAAVHEEADAAARKKDRVESDIDFDAEPRGEIWHQPFSDNDINITATKSRRENR